MAVRFLVAAAALAGAAACVTVAEPETAIAGPPDTCGAGAFQSLVGQPQSAILSQSLPARTRVVCHECAVTMDYREDRLNFWLDADGKVARVTCG